MLPRCDTQRRKTDADELQRAVEEARMISLMNPAARARRMRKRDCHRAPPFMLDIMLATDQLIQRAWRQKSFDRQPPDGNEQSRADDAKLVLQPRCAVRPFRGRGYSVTASARTGARIAASDRGNIDALPRCRLVEAHTLEPAKERLARAPGERFSSVGLHLSRRLSN